MSGRDERCEAVCRTQPEAVRRAAAMRELDRDRRYVVVRAGDHWVVQSTPKLAAERGQNDLFEEESSG
jgi:hypothetical protein